MFDENLARIRTHRNNIHRYLGLLRTKLSDLERDFIEKRMAGEQAALDALVAETLPVTCSFPKNSSSLSSSMGAAS
jgi:hypothetical protein